MKLQYLSLLVSAILITGSASAAETHNNTGSKLNFHGQLNSIRCVSGSRDNNSERSFIRYGIRGENHLSEKIVGFGAWEQEVRLKYSENNRANGIFTRLGFAGIRYDDAGSLDYGRNYGIIHDTEKWLEVTPTFYNGTIAADNFLMGRASSVLTYRNTNLFGNVDGLDFALQYQGKNDTEIGRPLQEANGDGHGLSVIYDFGNNISAGVAASSSFLTPSQKLSRIAHNKDKKAKAYSLGLKYDNNTSIYTAAVYSETYNMTPYGNFKKGDHGVADKAYNLGLVAQYQFDFGLRPSLRYQQSSIEGNLKGKSHSVKKYVEVGASYKLNKHMWTLIDYRINLLHKNSFTKSAQIPTGNIIGAGIRYVF